MRVSIAAIIFGVCLFTGCSSQPPEPTYPTYVPTDDDERRAKELAQGGTDFGLALYEKVRLEQDGNIALSPYGISAAMAMTFAGARGETRDQIGNALRFGLSPEQIPPASAALSLSLMKEGNGATLRIANRLWGQKGSKFLPQYLSTTREYFGSEFAELDFVADASRARQSINRWVAGATRDKVKEVLPRGSLRPDTRLVLTNAMYFLGEWEEPFEEEDTSTGSFVLLDGTKKLVPLMNQTLWSNYSEFDSGKIIELKYENSPFSMVLLLPTSDDGLGDLEEGLTADFLASSLDSLSRAEVDVTLPRFKVHSHFSLAEQLAEMGMPLPFSSSADFSGISENEKLMISEVIHQASVETNEKGTEVVMATRVGEALSIGETHTFRADHPFVFLIRDHDTGCLLFLGRVTDPTE